MLDGLRDIAWHKRTHAFGEASNLPALLRALDEGGAASDGGGQRTPQHRLTALDEDLGDYVRRSGEATDAGVTLDGYFVDILVERL